MIGLQFRQLDTQAIVVPEISTAHNGYKYTLKEKMYDIAIPVVVFLLRLASVICFAIGTALIISLI